MTYDITAPTEPLSRFIGAAETLVDEGKIHLDGDGLSLSAIDPANVGAVHLTLGADSLDSYTVEDDVTLGVNLNRLADILSLDDDGDPWHLADDGRKITLRQAGLEYTLATIDPDSIREEPDIPDLDLTAEVTVEWRRVEQALTAADMVSNHVTIATDNGHEGITVRASGDTDDVDKRIDADELVAGTGITGETSAASTFSLDYLKDFKRPIPADAEVRLRFGEEFPIKIDWAADGVDVLYMLAPRISSD